MRKFIPVALGLVLLSLGARSQAAPGRQELRAYDVAAYLYPAYAADDPRLRPFWPTGIGEWETVLTMQQRNPGHYWDRRPLWGPVNEADPAVMEMEIDQAADHGVNVFIFDWYWYDGRPFMETTLTNGFLKAPNRDRMKFYLMWANHDVVNVWDTRISTLPEQNVIWTGKVDRDEFEKVCLRNIELFFKQPEYYKIDGKPVFMIYDVKNFIEGLGGVKEAAAAVRWFRRQVRKAGFPGLELQFTMWGPNLNYSGFDAGKTDRPREALVRKVGFNSSSHYQFAHFIYMDDEYPHIVEQAVAEWERIDRDFSLPFYPHVSIGWDNSPRIGKSPCTRNNTPENFESALRKARAWVDAHPGLHPLITINSWNEWTETSYLEPDNVYGYGYLEAVKRVFVDEGAVLYQRSLDDGAPFPEYVAEGGARAEAVPEGLRLSGAPGQLRLDRYYALGERTVRYEVAFSLDAQAYFCTDARDFTLSVDVPGKRVSVGAPAGNWKDVPFLEASHPYRVELEHAYLKNTARLTDLVTGASMSVSLESDGPGGVGRGALQPGFSAGSLWDYYVLGLTAGSSLTLRKTEVSTVPGKVFLLVCGDSITQPDGYCPKADFPRSWTMLLAAQARGKVLCSGRGGTTIDQVLLRLPNELPSLRPQYVMVTIGTNGGNTEEKLCRLVEYIRAQGCIPILNNIPCNESGTQVAVNALVARVREKYGLKGCLFDLATSLDGDGKEVDKSMMYWEDYPPEIFGGMQVWHHPNPKGAEAMYQRVRQDVPELF